MAKDKDILTVREYLKIHGYNSKKKSKYHSQFSIVDGIRFHSIKEADYYQNLKLLEKHGEITELILQPRFPYEIHYVLRNNEASEVVKKKGCYIADFKVTYKTGEVKIIDTKGFQTPKFKRDKEIVEKLYGIKIIIQ